MIEGESAGAWPFDRDDPLLPPPAFDIARQRCPVAAVELWDGSDAWGGACYRDIRALRRNPAM